MSLIIGANAQIALQFNNNADHDLAVLPWDVGGGFTAELQGILAIILAAQFQV